MKYHKVPEQIIKEIARYLTSVNVPAIVGSNLVNIANALQNTEVIEEKEEPKKEEPKK